MIHVGYFFLHCNRVRTSTKLSTSSTSQQKHFNTIYVLTLSVAFSVPSHVFLIEFSPEQYTVFINQFVSPQKMNLNGKYLGQLSSKMPKCDNWLLSCLLYNCELNIIGFHP